MARGPGLVTIAVDPHKRINVVEVIDAASTVLACQQWAIEGATGVGKNLAQRLVASDEVVLDVPSQKSSLVRAFSATSGRKSDEVDAHAVALAALNSPDLERVRADDHATALRLLASRRKELMGLRTQAVNRVHRELQILIPGGAKGGLSATRAKAMLSSVRPRDEVGKQSCGSRGPWPSSPGLGAVGGVPRGRGRYASAVHSGAGRLRAIGW